MVTKWFIQDNKRKGFGYYKEYTYCPNPNGRPSFTRQTALAKFFKTKEEANDHLFILAEMARNEIQKATGSLENITEAKKNWQKLSNDDKFAIICKTPLEVKYVVKSTSSWRSHDYIAIMDTHNGWDANGNPIPRKYDDLDKEEKQAIDNIDWNSITEKFDKILKYNTVKLKYITENLVAVEHPMEFKFNDKERMKISWSIRDADATNYGYCNGCGGAIPEIPQVNIGGYVKLCAICMNKLAMEAKIQVDKISQEVLDHYETDRFLRNV